MNPAFSTKAPNTQDPYATPKSAPLAELGHLAQTARDFKPFSLENQQAYLGNLDSTRLDTLPPCCFTISKRGQQKIREKKGSAVNSCHPFDRRAVLCHSIVAQGDSACPAQTGRSHADSNRPTKQLDQHHNSALAISHLIDTLNPCKWRFTQAHKFARLEESLWL